MELLETTIWGNSLKSWGSALLIFLFTTLILHFFKRVILQRLVVLVQKTKTDVDDIVAELIDQTKFLFLLMISAYFVSLTLTLPPIVYTTARTIVIIIVLIQVGFWSTGLITSLVNRRVRKQLPEDAGEATAINARGIIAKIALWVIIALWSLDNIPGVEVNTLIASMGIGGIAVALAVQNILGDLFASLSIVLDKPFVIGDSIVVDEYTGTVEHIGLKSTRIRSLTGEQLVFSNSDLLKSRIRNYKHMEERRISFTIGVDIKTPYDKLISIPDMVKEIVEVNEMVSCDRVHLVQIGDFSYLYEIVYHVLTSDQRVYLNIQPAINLGIIKRFEDEGIEMPYPTQRLYIEK
ncbi:MAG: mechanosensitive ion channel family protein [Chloroflexota bacterium]